MATLRQVNARICFRLSKKGGVIFIALDDEPLAFGEARPLAKVRGKCPR